MSVPDRPSTASHDEVFGMASGNSELGHISAIKAMKPALTRSLRSTCAHRERESAQVTPVLSISGHQDSTAMDCLAARRSRLPSMLDARRPAMGARLCLSSRLPLLLVPSVPSVPLVLLVSLLTAYHGQEKG